MRIWLVVLMACAAPQLDHTAPPCGGAASPGQARLVDRSSVQAVLVAQQAAWNRGDLVAYMAGYAKSDALIFTSGGKIRRGWQDAYDHYKARYGTDRAGMGQLSFEIIQIDPIGDRGAVVLGRWKLDGEHAAGGVFTVVLEQRAEGWRIIHDHTSVDAP